MLYPSTDWRVVTFSTPTSIQKPSCRAFSSISSLIDGLGVLQRLFSGAGDIVYAWIQGAVSSSCSIHWTLALWYAFVRCCWTPESIGDTFDFGLLWAEEVFWRQLMATGSHRTLIAAKDMSIEAEMDLSLGSLQLIDCISFWILWKLYSTFEYWFHRELFVNSLFALKWWLWVPWTPGSACCLHLSAPRRRTSGPYGPISVYSSRASGSKHSPILCRRSPVLFSCL